jgi:hypothetical protein
MAARGARSRKVVEKQITKENTKRYDDRFIPSIATKLDASRVMSPVAGWKRPPAYPSGASVHSGDSGGSSGRLSVAGSKLSSTLASVSLKEERFVDKGKQTSAPRGRGGGVPMKTTDSKNDRAQMKSVKPPKPRSSHGFRPSSRATTIDENSLGVKSWDRTKIWYGGLTAPKPFQGFEHVRKLLPFLY